MNRMAPCARWDLGQCVIRHGWPGQLAPHGGTLVVLFAQAYENYLS